MLTWGAIAKKVHLSLCCFALFGVLGCGNITLGPGAAPNDAAPVGAVVSSGRLQGLSGNTASGAVQIYRVTETNEYVVRFIGITLPVVTGLKLVAMAGGVERFTATFRFFDGTQNYYTGIQSQTTFDSVIIRNPSNPNTPDYGIATLTASP